MKFITKQDAIAMNPGEDLYAIRKSGDNITILADIEDNQNTTGNEPGYHDACVYRVELYGMYGGDWSLDKACVLDSSISALGEARGSNAGGICFAYEDAGDWGRYKTSYECLFDNIAGAEPKVAVIDKASELYELPDGSWFVILKGVLL